jgi:Fe-S-cluster-containing dehydrogenase component
MAKLMFNAELCTGCRACELACSFHFNEKFVPSKSRIRIVRMDEEGIDVPVGCEHCDDAVCMLVCPVKALYLDKETGAVVLDPDICIGCKECLAVCPFGAIHYDEDDKKFYKCDLCGGEPECVKWCVTGAVKVYDDLDDHLRNRRSTRAEKTARALSESRMAGSKGGSK